MMAMARRVAPPSTPAMDTGMMNSVELSTASYVRNHQKDPGQQKRQLTIHLVIVLLIGWSLREDVTSCTTRKRIRRTGLLLVLLARTILYQGKENFEKLFTKSQCLECIMESLHPSIHSCKQHSWLLQQLPFLWMNMTASGLG